jgi:hypothetical protein
MKTGVPPAFQSEPIRWFTCRAILDTPGRCHGDRLRDNVNTLERAASTLGGRGALQPTNSQHCAGPVTPNPNRTVAAMRSRPDFGFEWVRVTILVVSLMRKSDGLHAAWR